MKRSRFSEEQIIAMRPGFGAISDTGKRAQIGSPEWHLSAAELADASARVPT